MSSQLISSETMNNVKGTWAKVGTMLIVAHVLSTYLQNNGEGLFNQAWIQASLFTIIGFNVYDVIVSKMIQIDVEGSELQAVIDDTIKVGTMMVVSTGLKGAMNGTNEFSEKWMKGSLYTLVGFAGYRLVTQKMVPEVAEEYRTAVHTQVQFMTMMVISRLISGEPFDADYINSCLYTLIGFASYDLVVSKI